MTDVSETSASQRETRLTQLLVLGWLATSTFIGSLEENANLPVLTNSEARANLRDFRCDRFQL